MPQETNLNVSPYFDDFDSAKDYYKVLFKPGYPVQARELTTLQSILQNQVEKFGNHIFKEGAKVIPGQTSYNSEYSAVELENSFSGLSLTLYLNEVVGTIIRGEISGVRAKVEKVLLPKESERSNATLYVSYISGNSTSNVSQGFNDGENLITENAIQNSSVIFIEEETFATTISENSNSVASSFTVQDGVYFLRGTFVNVNTQTIILDQYSNTPSYRIGFNVREEIVTADADPSLYDNAQGFNNYTAPGADRFKLTAFLTKKSINDFNDQNFVEIATVQNGFLRNNPNDTDYNYLNDTLATRTYEESGEYYVKPFKVTCIDSLNDGEGNNGIFNANQLTYDGNDPSDDLSVYRVSPGKAYVRGYRVETTAPTFLDVEKPRETKELKSQSINYFTGPSVSLNNVSGSPVIGINTTYTVSLRNERVVNKKIANGNEIGVARVYDFALESGSYNNVLPATNEWDISLFDIQTYTEISLNNPTSISESTFIKGNSSGATGFVRYTTSNSKKITLYDTKGSFIVGENFSFNGNENGRIAVAVTHYGLNDVKSIYGFTAIGSTFNSDTTQSTKIEVGEAAVSAKDFITNTSTITIPNLKFSKILKKGDLVSFFDNSNFIIELSGSKGISTEVSVEGQTFFEVNHRPSSCDFYLNGIRLNSNNYVSLASTAITLNTPTNVSDNLETVNYAANIVEKQQVIAYNGQTIIPFTTTTSLTNEKKEDTFLFVNGIKIDNDQFNVYNGTGIIHFNESVLSGSYVQWQGYSLSDKIGIATLTTTGIQTDFSVNYTPGNVDVYLDGVKLIKNEDYTENTSGTVLSLTTPTVTPGKTIEIVQYNSSTVSSAVTYTAVGLQTSYSATYTVGNLDVFYNGVKLRPSEFVAIDGSEVYIPTVAIAGDKVEIISYASNVRVGYASTAITNNQVDYSIDNSSRNFEVFVDGIKYSKNDYQIFGANSSFVTSYPLFANDVIDILAFDPNYFTNQKFIATEGQQEIIFSYNVGLLDVYLNGVKLNKQDYIAIDGQTISLNVPMNAGDVADVYGYTNSAFTASQGDVLYDKTFASIDSITTNSGFTVLTVKGVTGVVGICNGELPSTTVSVSDLQILQTKATKSTDNSLFTPLPRRNVESVNLSSSNLTVRKQYDVIISTNSTNTVFAGSNETFLPFDEERYVLTHEDGTVLPLTSDKFVFGAGSTRLTINGLTKNGRARLITTLRKVNVVSKSKQNNRSKSLVVSYSSLPTSGVGTTSLNDGLAYGNYPYGTRVQDEEISLNVPDIISLHGVFESFGLETPSAPRLSLSTLTGPNATTRDLILGERVRGTVSNARALYVERTDDSTIEFVYKNKKTFSVGEIVIFEESGIEAVISAVTTNGKDITSSFILDNGQRDTFYDYGRIKRKNEKKAPKRRLKIYFQQGFYNASDDGDITTVNSYNAFDYSRDIQYYNDTRNTDIVDIRPRVSNYTVTEGSNSPFEFDGRIFTQSGNSAKNILASDESILLDYKFYLPRIDKVFLNKNGKFEILKGLSAEVPNPPTTIDDSIEVAQIFLPPYLYDTKNASVSQKQYKRYTMGDISKIEDRLTNLEKYTTLSFLEIETSNLFIPDSNGLNKFKSGFLVDNFKNSSNQEIRNGIKNSINLRKGELRPSHYTTGLDLVLGSNNVIGVGETSDPYADLNFVTTLTGSNVKKSGDVVSLDYSEIEWLSQTFATRTEQVTPYLVNFWEGTLDLTPDSDVWIDSVRIEPENLQTSGNVTSTIEKITKLENYNSQIGFIPTIWESWNVIWTGNQRMMGSGDESNLKSIYNKFYGNDESTSTNGDTRWIGLEKNSSGVSVESIQSDSEINVLQYIETEEFDTISIGEKTISSNLIPFMRSRNVEFVSRRLKPYTRVYGFFDGVDVNSFIVPKLIEITMNSGKFNIGETISGYIPGINYDENSSDASPRITFRASVPNHKTGPYNSPTTTFNKNPYNSNLTLPSVYSSTSTIINVDTFSLAYEPQGEYFGYIAKGMKLYGETSGAEATIQSVRLITDESGMVSGSFFIPNPNVDVNPKFTVGEKVFKLTNSVQNGEVINSVSEDKYLSTGSIQIIDDGVSSVKEPKKLSKTLFKGSNVSSFSGKYIDPLAQTFTVDDETGVFVTAIDLYFESKDNELPITCELRTVDYNVPSNIILPFSQVTLESSSIKTSSNASVATKVKFKSPVYLEGNRDYAIVISSNSNEYRLWTSRLGEVDVKSQSGSDSSQILVSTQPLLGSLYKTQNASNWQPSIFDDLTFKLYRAQFVESGNISFFNPNLSKGNSNIPLLSNDPISIVSRQVRIGVSTGINDSNLKPGNTIVQLTSGATGNYVKSLGKASTLTVTNVGQDYSPSSGSQTYANVSLQTLTGSGKNAVATITILDGKVASATLTNGGVGYSVGDVVTATIGDEGLGSGVKLTVNSISMTNELVLEDVQGSFKTGIANTIFRYNDVGVATTITPTSGSSNLYISQPIDVIADGSNFEVSHKNHGMHSDVNYVTLSNILPDTNPTKITVSYSKDYNGSFAVDSISQFTTFENIDVSASNPGYLLINEEVIKYEGFSDGKLTNITRGIDGTIKKAISSGDLIYKYELNGVSLRRINKTHELKDSTLPNSIGLDYYNIKVDMSNTDYGIDRSESQTINPPLYFRETKSCGGNSARSTQNIQFEAITPNVQTFIPNLTGINADIRTVSATSISGTETSFIDQGFEPVLLNRTNYLSTPRLVASKINEKNLLETLPGNKSFTLRMNMETGNDRLSPIIDTTRVNLITTTNRINSVITDYSEDSRVNTLLGDPSDCQYVTKIIRLKNPANSIKLYLSAHVNVYSDLRAFYSIDNTENDNPIFVPFPGYKNLDSFNQIIDQSNSDGNPDMFVDKNYISQSVSTNDSFSNYEFTANNVSEFKYFRIKVVMTSTNQAYVPKIKNLRALALA